MTDAKASQRSPTIRILAVVIFTLLCYIDIGMPMAVIPVFVHHTLNYSPMLAGFAVSVQYFATFGSRAFAGRMTDQSGPRDSVLIGLVVGALSGLLLMASGLTASHGVLSIFLLMLSRVGLGCAESFVATGAIMWNIGRLGPARTAQVISWNGVCSYGGIALGAPVGELLSHLPGAYGGLTTVGILSTALLLAGLVLALRYKPLAPVRSDSPPLPFGRVLQRVLPYGSILALGSVGFGAISSCLSLYFTANDWSGAATALAIFGTVFVCIRFLFAREIAKRGGNKVALISLVAEAAGLLLLAQSNNIWTADLGAALTGAGFSLLFPALGVGAVASVGAENRGAALGAFSVFLDIAIGISGPLLGLIIQHAGYGALFLFSAVSSLGGATGCMLMRARPGKSAR